MTLVGFFFTIITSFFISFAWLFYLRSIDLFEKEKIYHVAATFVLGTLVPFIIYPLHDYVFVPLGVKDSSDPIMSFIYYTFVVGLVEEIIKCIPLIIIIFLFRKAVNEPLDYVKYICVSALGFAFGENIEYAVIYGQYVLVGRSILSVPGHMFFSAIFIYGVIEYKHHGKNILHVFKYILLGALAHGTYDYLLEFEIRFLGVFLNILFFFLIISVFVTILNNNMNFSPFYDPKKAIDQEKVRKNMVHFYVPIIIGVLILTSVYKDAETALSVYITLVFWKSTILYVLIVRLSRFSIFPNVKKKIKLEFPFHYKRQPDRNDFNLFFGLLTVKGETHNEAKLASLYQEEIKVVPLSLKKSYLGKTFNGIIESKIFLKESSVYVLKVYLDETKLNFKHFLVVPKTTGVSHTELDEPIVSINSIETDKRNKLVFHEWVILKESK